MTQPAIRVLGFGMGPQHVTPEVSAALRSADYVVAAAKREGDELLAVRRAICEAHDVELVVVPDPERDRDDPADYPAAVRDWHAARVAAYRTVLAERGGTAAFLVWGDPSLYDSTIRVVERLGEEFGAYDVLPGISAPQLLAARHRIVLHPVGRAVHVTTGRRLAEAVAAGQDNIVAMLNRDVGVLEEAGLADWSIWWGANLGDASEALVAGRVGDVVGEIAAAREAARAAAGWVMDVFLVRAPDLGAGART